MFNRKPTRKPRVYLISECERASEIKAGHARVAAQSGQVKAAGRARKRIGMSAAAFVFAFSILVVRLWSVSSGHEEFRLAGRAVMEAGQERQEIHDRNGALLATNLPMRALEIAGRDVWDAQETALALNSVFSDIDVPDLAAKLAAGRYVEVKKNITPAQEAAVFNLGLPGVRFTPRIRRFYPHANQAAHLVGHTEAGKGGVMGLERRLEEWPSGQPLVSSIDIRAQQVLLEELASAAERFNAEAAWGAIMDVATGEVIALANVPDFDPNNPGGVPADARRNRALYDNYELGSAFKVFTAASVLEAGLATETTIYDAKGSYRVGGRVIRDFHGENRELTLSEVVQHSSNIGAARMAADLGPERQKEFLAALGMFEALPVELYENRAPQLPGQWGPVEAATIAYGHGISVTPLHLLAAFSAVVDGGVYRVPTFLKVEQPAQGERVLSPKTSDTMRRVLRRVVTDGTASFAEATGYFPIGKTATADKVKATGGYERNARLASFVGAFPGDAPRYSILVSLDNPKAVEGTFGYATAGWNAAPAFSSLVNRLAPVLGVMPKSEGQIDPAYLSEERKAQLVVMAQEQDRATQEFMGAPKSPVTPKTISIPIPEKDAIADLLKEAN